MAGSGSGLDYYNAPINPVAAIKAAGYNFVIRYVDDPNLGGGKKLITPTEYANLIAAGVTVYLVFEQTTTDWSGGFFAGVRNATRALAGADALGYRGLIFLAVDQHLAPEQIPTALEYFDGAARVLGAGRVGVYGFSELIQATQAKNVGVAYWQCGHQPAANAGVHIWQRNDGTVLVAGVQCDVNVALMELSDSGDDELTDEEHTMLADVRNWLFQLNTAWGGGVTDDKNTPYDLRQFVMRNNVECRQLRVQVQALADKLASAPPAGPSGEFGQLSDVDVQRVAAAVVELLAAKLAAGDG